MAKPKIAFARLRDILDYNPKTGKFTTRPKKVGSTHVWNGDPRNRFRSVYADGRGYLEHRLAWLWMTGEWPPSGFVIDHINGDGADNRWSNLRLATPSQNQRNRVRQNKNNSSGLTGAYRIDGATGAKGGKQWFAAIGNRTIGSFHTKEEAHEAYKKAALERFGDFAPERLKKTL